MKPSAPHVAGSGFVKIFCVVCGVLTLSFAAIAAMGLRQHWWASTPCVVLGGDVVRSTAVHRSPDGRTQGKPRYVAEVRFRYEHAGRPCEGKDSVGSDRKQEAARARLTAYPPGLATICFVDPSHPETNAVLRPTSWGWAAFPLVPLIPFALCLRAWRRSAAAANS